MSFLKEFTMILSCSNISKSFGEKHILKQVSFHLEDHEKAAIVGINGAGKSTLLKIIIGELACDEGGVALSKGASIGYLAQHQDLDSESTIHDALLEVKRPILQMEERIRSLELDMKSASGEGLENMLEEYSRLTHQFELEGGYACRSEITGVLKGLGFAEEEFSKPINALSGGQKTRVSLGKLLLTKPDILLLDEPTNHLDMESIAWLETYLKTYSGSVIIVAHDRYFLDRVVTKIVELDNGTGTVFSGNYTAYSDKKAMLRDARIRAYLNQQQEIRHQEAVIAKLKSFNREKSIRRAESREKMLDKITQNCMGKGLYNGLVDILKGKTITIEFNSGTNGGFGKRNEDGSFGITLGKQMESNCLIHEMMHAFQSYRESTSSYNESTLNAEIETHFVQYLYLRSLKEYPESKWETRDNTDPRRRSIKDINRFIDERGFLRGDATITSLKEKLKEAASTFESNGYTAQRGFVFASNRPILDNFKNLREITKNCI